MDVFLAIMVYACIGIWYVNHRPKGGVKKYHLLISYTLFLPILLVHTVIYLSGRPWRKRQP